jgi:hypothetical protein
VSCAPAAVGRGASLSSALYWLLRNLQLRMPHVLGVPFASRGCAGRSKCARARALEALSTPSAQASLPLLFGARRLDLDGELTARELAHLGRDGGHHSEAAERSADEPARKLDVQSGELLRGGLPRSRGRAAREHGVRVVLQHVDPLRRAHNRRGVWGRVEGKMHARTHAREAMGP